MKPRLQEIYETKVIPALMAKHQYKNVMQVPRLEKIVVSVCTGEAVQNPKVLNVISDEVAAISGQKPVITKARQSISNFKLRKGMPIGVMVTLRRQQMWYFLDKLINLALPRVRDFRGLSPRAFDGHGNYSLGLKEQIVFPEINYDKVDKIRGLNITICTSAETDVEAKSLLEELGFPFRAR